MRFSITNIRIEEDILKELKLRAVHEGKRVAELIREAIREFLGKNKEKAVRKGKDPILSIIGLCKTGIKNGSERHDEFLYGKR